MSDCTCEKQDGWGNCCRVRELEGQTLSSVFEDIALFGAAGIKIERVDPEILYKTEMELGSGAVYLHDDFKKELARQCKEILAKAPKHKEALSIRGLLAECDDLRAQLLASQERERVLREALEFYRNPKNFSGVYRNDQGEIIEETDGIEDDVSEHPPGGPMQEFGMLADEALERAGRE